MFHSFIDTAALSATECKPYGRRYVKRSTSCGGSALPCTLNQMMTSPQQKACLIPTGRESTTSSSGSIKARQQLKVPGRQPRIERPLQVGQTGLLYEMARRGEVIGADLLRHSIQAQGADTAGTAWNNHLHIDRNAIFFRKLSASVHRAELRHSCIVVQRPCSRARVLAT